MINSLHEWNKVKHRFCSHDAHGGIQHCIGGTEETGILEWYKFVHEKVMFEPAKQECIDIGGLLFTGVNGTKDQIDFFYDKFQDNCFWIEVSVAF